MMIAPKKRCETDKRGFTLLQVLVAIGIIAMLAAISLTMLVRVRAQSKKSAIFYQLQMISTGLEAYRHDFGNYPQIERGGAIEDNGAFALCRFLFAPAPETAPPGARSDGQQNLGFKTKAAGKTYGPYLLDTTFRFGYAVQSGNGPGWVVSSPADTTTATQIDPTVYNRMVIVDPYALKYGIDPMPIVYCPALLQKPRSGLTNAYYLAAKSSLPPAPPKTVYIDFDDLTAPPTAVSPDTINYRKLLVQDSDSNNLALVLERLQVMLGDLDKSGKIDGTEKETIDAPYVLWSPGVDGIFGPDASKGPNYTKHDDVIYSNLAP